MPVDGMKAEAAPTRATASTERSMFAMPLQIGLFPAGGPWVVETREYTPRSNPFLLRASGAGPCGTKKGAVNSHHKSQPQPIAIPLLFPLPADPADPTLLATPCDPAAQTGSQRRGRGEEGGAVTWECLTGTNCPV
eukprot:578078-Rhodomonas_salina.1